MATTRMETLILLVSQSIILAACISPVYIADDSHFDPVLIAFRSRFR